MIIAVDFDGTIVEHEYPEIGKLKEGAIEMLKSLQEQGHELILWTCRADSTLEEAVVFMREHGIEFDAVNDNISTTNIFSRKVYADVYIDDRAVGYPGNWFDIPRILWRQFKIRPMGVKKQ